MIEKRTSKNAAPAERRTLVSILLLPTVMAAKVLVIDDDGPTRDGLVELLELEGYQATPAKDGREGLALLQNDGYKPDVILLDLQMPGMSGWEFVMEIGRDLAAPPPIIVVSSSPHLAPQSPSVISAIAKTADLDVLLGVVRETVSGSHI